MKKIFTLFLSLSLVLGLTACSGGQDNGSQSNPPGSDAPSDKLLVYYFWGDGCPHCETQKPFLEEMKDKYPGIEVREYETWKNRDNAQFLNTVAQYYGVQVQGVPTTFIGEGKPFVGFTENMKQDMENRIKDCLSRGCANPDLSN